MVFATYLVKNHTRGQIMEKEDMLKKIARLETMNDYLTSEMASLDKLTRKLGFSNGLATLKKAAKELLKEQQKKDPTDLNME